MFNNKGILQQKDITNLNLYAPNIIGNMYVPNIIKIYKTKIVTKLKG